MKTIALALALLASATAAPLSLAGTPVAPAGHGLLEVAQQAGNLGTFVRAAQTAGLADRLSGEGPHTVFAPTDEAFARLPEGMLAELMKPGNQALLAGLVGDHVVPGRLLASEMITMKTASVSGLALGIAVVGDVLQVEEANVVQRGLLADNGVIHVIDAVILPDPVERMTAE
jgi:transforming growth factor-beta-induced protein